jgi:hypothetical protein
MRTEPALRGELPANHRVAPGGASIGCYAIISAHLRPACVSFRTILAMDIETSYGHGAIRCDHPATGEHFEGSYSGVSDGASGLGTSTTYANLGGVHGSATGLSGVFLQSLKANGMALLIGDRGTLLDCHMDIQRGIRPHGMGVCMDNAGKAYRLQF